MRFKSVLLALALVLALSGQALAARTMVHFFVVPATIAEEKLHAFNAFLVRTAGGFTVSRSTGADTASFGAAYAPENLSYTVAAPKNIGKEIKAYLKKNCGEKDVFLLVWPADRP
jgi:hypothetical protein